MFSGFLTRPGFLQVEIPQLNQLMRELLELSCCDSCPFSSTAAAKCFAGLLNKHPAGTRMRLQVGASLIQLPMNLEVQSSASLKVFYLVVSSYSLQEAIWDNSLVEVDSSFRMPALMHHENTRVSHWCARAEWAKSTAKMILFFSNGFSGSSAFK